MSEAPAVEGARFAAFVSTFDDIADGHQRLLTLLRLETRLVAEGTVDDLMSCLSEKRDVLSRLARLEQRRQEELGEIGRHAEAADPPGRVTELLPLIPEPYRAGLQSCQVRLDGLTAAIVEVNRINGRLVGRTLEHIGNLLGLLNQLAFPPSNYEATGRLIESPNVGRTLGEG